MKTILLKTFVCSFVLANLAGAAPILRLSTSAVAATASAGVNAAAETVEIFNAGDGTLNPTFSASSSWLSASAGPARACTTPGFKGNCIPVNITFNSTALAIGTYTAFISVIDPNAVDSPQTISVTVSVGGVPASLDLYVTPNGGKATTTLDTRSPVSVQPSTATGGNWLAVGGSGTFSFFYEYAVVATSQTGQAPGDYTGSIKISGSNYAPDNQTVQVNLHVTNSPIVVLTPATVNLLAGQGGTASQTVSIANGGGGGLTVTGATPTVSNGTGWLSATVGSGQGSVTITADATNLQPGTYSGSVALATNAANNAALTIPVSLLVIAQSGPTISFGGVVDNAIGMGEVAPGDILAAYGSQFSTVAPANATAVPLATTLADVQVLVNGAPAPLYYTSSGQIDLQLPYETPPGLATVQVVRNGQPGNTVSLGVTARAPRILVFPLAGTPPIIINYTDGSVPTTVTTPLPNHPAKAGDVLVIYAIGLGQTDPAATTGAGANLTPLQTIAQPAYVMFGGGFQQTIQVTPQYVGLTPNFVGLYQINVPIPQTVAPGSSIELSLNVQGSPSNTVQIAVQ